MGKGRALFHLLPFKLNIPGPSLFRQAHGSLTESFRGECYFFIAVILYITRIVLRTDPVYMPLTRQKIALYLRKLYLLQFVDHLMFLGDVLKHRKSNQEILLEHPGFVSPPAYLAYDAFNHTKWQAYHNMGVRHSQLISELIKEHLHKTN